MYCIHVWIWILCLSDDNCWEIPCQGRIFLILILMVSHLLHHLHHHHHHPLFSRNLPCVPIDSKWITPSVEPSINNILINGTWSMANPSPNCQCSTPQKTIMLPDCPPGAGGLPPPQVSPQSVNPRSACNIMVSNRNTWPLAWNVCLIWQPGLDLKTCVSSPN